MPTEVLYEETVREPRWYSLAWATVVGALLGGLVVSETGWSPPRPLFVAYIATMLPATTVVIAPLVLTRTTPFSAPPLRISLSLERLAVGYLTERWVTQLWSLNYSFRIDEVDSCWAERSLRAIFLPRVSWFAAGWSFQVPYLATGIKIRTTSRERYWVSTRHPEHLCEAIERARLARSAPIETAS